MSKELEERLRAEAQNWDCPRGFDDVDMHGMLFGAAATLTRYREALERIAKCETSMNGHIARQALEPNPTPAQ